MWIEAEPVYGALVSLAIVNRTTIFPREKGR